MNFTPYSREYGGFKVSAKKEAETEITMHGEIVESVPVDFWTGEKIEGDFIVRSEFMSALNEVKTKKLTLRMDSPGGDAGVSIFIHNKLREMQNNGTEITCIVEGIAMSGGSLIMCACNNVKVNPSSLIMIHKCWSYVFGAYNGDDLRSLAESYDAWDKAQVAIYARKTNLSETVISHMMGDTTYMTGAEAVEKGFADELLDTKTFTLAASADRSMIFSNGRAIKMPKGMLAPETMPIREDTVSTATAEDINMSVTSDTDDNMKGCEIMACNLDELRAENSELAQTIETEIRTAVSAEMNTSVENAVASERQRLAEIDEIASLYDAETVADAKYNNPCTAAELALRVAQKEAKKGTTFVADMLEDAKASGTKEIETVVSAKEEPVSDEVQTRNTIHSIFHKEDK